MAEKNTEKKSLVEDLKNDFMRARRYDLAKDV